MMLVYWSALLGLAGFFVSSVACSFSLPEKRKRFIFLSVFFVVVYIASSVAASTQNFEHFLFTRGCRMLVLGLTVAAAAATKLLRKNS